MQHETYLFDEISKQLKESGEKIAVAESVTSGLLQNAFSQMNEAMGFFEGGITTYTMKSKVDLLRVDPKEAEQSNCVSPQISDEMALNISKMFRTQWAIAITGYASPVKESGYELFAYYSICHLDKILSSQKIKLNKISSPEEAQKMYVQKVLYDLKDLIEDALTESNNISKN